MFNLQMLVRKFGGLPSKKFGGGENMLNLVRFRTPFHFEREYRRNGQRYLKSENLVHYSIPCVQRQKFGELWSTNYRDLEVELYPKNRLFWKTIFRPLGSAAP